MPPEFGFEMDIAYLSYPRSNWTNLIGSSNFPSHYSGWISAQADRTVRTRIFGSCDLNEPKSLYFLWVPHRFRTSRAAVASFQTVITLFVFLMCLWRNKISISLMSTRSGAWTRPRPSNEAVNRPTVVRYTLLYPHCGLAADSSPDEVAARFQVKLSS